MSGMLNLRDVLELVIDGFNNGAFSQKELILQKHQAILHILLDRSDEMQVLSKKLFNQGLGNVTFVGKELTEKCRCQIGYGFTVIQVARGEIEGQDFPPVIDDQMEFEAIKPTH